MDFSDYDNWGQAGPTQWKPCSWQVGRKQPVRHSYNRMAGGGSYFRYNPHCVFLWTDFLPIFPVEPVGRKLPLPSIWEESTWKYFSSLPPSASALYICPDKAGRSHTVWLGDGLGFNGIFEILLSPVSLRSTWEGDGECLCPNCEDGIQMER